MIIVILYGRRYLTHFYIITSLVSRHNLTSSYILPPPPPPMFKSWLRPWPSGAAPLLGVVVEFLPTICLCCFVPLKSPTCRASTSSLLHGWGWHWWLIAVVIWNVSTVDTSALSTLSLFVVTVNQFVGWWSTASVIPLQGFLPLYGIGWWYVELRCAGGVTNSSKGGCRLRWILACTPLPLLVPTSIVGT
jgi:hypothetical protein